MANTSYTCPSFINYNLSVYSLTNLIKRVTNNGNISTSDAALVLAEINVVCTGERALLAGKSLCRFADDRVDEIFKTNVYKARYGTPTPNF